MLRKEIEPPFKPHLTGAFDVTYFDPNCTEAPVQAAVDIRASPSPSDPEDVHTFSVLVFILILSEILFRETRVYRKLIFFVLQCFARFSFVAPAEFGPSTPHHNPTGRKHPSNSNLPLVLGNLQFHSSSPVLSSQHSTPHTPPAFSHPLAGMGIPRSPATFSLSSLTPSPHSHSPSPHALSIIASSSPRSSFSLDPGALDGEIGYVHTTHAHPLAHVHPLAHTHPSINLHASAPLAHLDADEDMENELKARDTPPPPALPNSHSNPALNTLTKPKPNRPPLWTSASTPNLFAVREDEEDDVGFKANGDMKDGMKSSASANTPNKKTFKAIMSSVFRKIK